MSVRCLDLAVERPDDGAYRDAELVAVSLPMHTATRLAAPLVRRIRDANPAAHLCAFGLYAPLNAGYLRTIGIDTVLGGEFEADLVDLARRLASHQQTSQPAPGEPQSVSLSRLRFKTPVRSCLPDLGRYARLETGNGTSKVVGYTEATRGCKHRCRHCPIVPVYDGQFRVVPVAVVLADVRAQVGQGAGHVTFGDPDFFNGPTHASRILGALHEEFPSLTYDVTIKVEHVLAHRSLLPLLARTGCLFVTSAVESVDDAVLGHLEKGHTRADFIEAARLCREAGLTLSPTFVAFTPWTTVDGYADLLDVVEALDLVGHVAPVQWGIRLLVTWQSRLLELADIARLVGAFDRKTLTFPWRHPDPRVDDLQRQVMGLAGTGVRRSRHDTFAAVRALAQPASAPPFDPPLARTEVPYLDEPWYC